MSAPQSGNERRVIDFVRVQRPADLISIRDLVDKVVIIKSFEVLPSRFGNEYVQIRGEVDGHTFTARTGSKTLIERLRRLEPVLSDASIRAKIVRRRSTRGAYYYDLDSP